MHYLPAVSCCFQISLELDELLDWLLTDVVADDAASAEAALRELDDKCEKLGNLWRILLSHLIY